MSFQSEPDPSPSPARRPPIDRYEAASAYYAVGIPPRPPRAGSTTPAGPASTSPEAGPARPFLQVWFRCAGQYRRVYRNRDGSAYEAVCPICAKSCTFRIGAGGSSRRMFEVSC